MADRYGYEFSGRRRDRGPNGGCTWKVVHRGSGRELLRVECDCGCPIRDRTQGVKARFDTSRSQVKAIVASLEQGGAARERAMGSHGTR